MEWNIKFEYKGYNVEMHSDFIVIIVIDVLKAILNYYSLRIFEAFSNL